MKLPSALLAVLLALLTPQASHAGPSETDVPFRLLHNQITVSVHIGARETQMFLDTDTDPSAIDAQIAKQLHLKVTGKSSVSSGEGSTHQVATPVVIPHIAVGGVHAKNVAALTSDFRGVSRIVHTPIAGVLGRSFLNGRIFQIDYPHHVLRFFGSESDLQSGSFIPFRVRDGLIVLDVAVNGRHGVATIDTGSSSGLILTPHGTKQLSLEAAWRASKPSKSTGYNGTVQTRKGTVAGAELAGVALGRVPAEFWSQAGPAPWMDCDIGNAVLKNYRITIDYVRDRFAIDNHG